MKLKFLTALLFLCVAGTGFAKQLDVGAPITVTDDGTINSGGALVKMVTLIFSSDYTGNINGGSASGLAGGSMTFYANQAGDYFAPITYTTTTGSIIYFIVR